LIRRCEALGFQFRFNTLNDLEPNGDPKGGAPFPGTYMPETPTERTPTPYPPYPANEFQKDTHPFLKSNLFIFLLGQTFAFVCWAIVASSVYGRFDQKLSAWEKWEAETQATMIRMDAYGTNASKWALSQHLDLIKQNSQRIERLETQASKIDVMAEKVSRIDLTVQRLEGR
jgi:hypothetical protein